MSLDNVLEWIYIGFITMLLGIVLFTVWYEIFRNRRK